MNTTLIRQQKTIEQFATSKRMQTLPEVAVRLLKIAQQADPDFNELSRIIRSDPVISGRVLKTVNSAIYGFRHRIESIEEAIPKIGLTMLRTIILGFHIAGQEISESGLKPVLQSHWRSSITQAAIAGLIGERIARGKADSFFLAAMLQDIGILAMLAEAPEEYVNHVLDRAKFPEVVSAEKSYFGFSHVDVTNAILDQWGLLDCFGNAIAHHHNRIVPPDSSKNTQLAAVLQASNMGAEMLFSTRNSALRLPAAVLQWADFLSSRLGINETTATSILEEVPSRVNEQCALFSFDIGSQVCPEQVITEAKELLLEIALNQQLEVVKTNQSRKFNLHEDLVYKDSLSGLHNRRFMNDKMFEWFEACTRNNQPAAAIFIDIDKFKSINDRFGHAIGDHAIQQTADWLKKSIRSQDILIRLGGDEFVIFFQNVPQSAFEQIVERMGSTRLEIDTRDEEPLILSFSIGGIYLPVNHGTVLDPNWLIDQADQAMYKAKRNGGGQGDIRIHEVSDNPSGV